MNLLLEAISLLLLLFASRITGQASCPPSSCIMLTQCEPMLDLLRTRLPENLRRVQAAICGFQGSRSKVCCPTETRPSLLPTYCGYTATGFRIIGGDVAPIGAYPWLAALGYRAPTGLQTSFICAGSVINERYVLTAAHCLDPRELGGKRLEVIRLGDWDLSRSPDCENTTLGLYCAPPHLEVYAEEVVVHSNYSVRAAYSDDIALIRLRAPLDFNRYRPFIQPVCIPPAGLNVGTLRNRLMVAAGWGLTENGFNNLLMEVNIPFADEAACRREFPGRFLDTQLCLGGEEDKDTCSGDSGGPVVMPGPQGPPFLQLGLVSYGSLPCAKQGVPAVYTSISPYRDWIEDNLRP